MVRRTACFEPFQVVVVCGWAALASELPGVVRVWSCLVKDFLQRLSIWESAGDRGRWGFDVERSSNVQPTMGACGTSGGSCCPFDGLSSQRRPASPPKALREAGGVLATHRARQRGFSHWWSRLVLSSWLQDVFCRVAWLTVVSTMCRELPGARNFVFVVFVFGPSSRHGRRRRPDSWRSGVVFQASVGWCCRQTHFTRNFSHAHCTSDCVHTHCMAQDEPSLNVSVVRIHSIHMSSMMLCVCAFVVSSCFSLSCFSPSFTSSLPHSSCSLLGTPSSMSTTPRVKTTAVTQNEEYCTIAIYNPLTGYEPKLLDDLDHSEASAMIFQDESGDIDTEPSYSCQAELDDEIIGKALSSPLFIQERQEPANRRQANHSHEESLLPAQSYFAHTSTGRPVYELSSC